MADDVVICCATSRDAERIQTTIAKRLDKFKLKLNQDKTRTIQFDRQDRHGSGAFDFLGFTFYLGLTRRGAVIPKLKTSGKRIRGKLKRVNEWCRRYRNQESMLSLWIRFCDKLRGHIWRDNHEIQTVQRCGGFNCCIHGHHACFWICLHHFHCG